MPVNIARANAAKSKVRSAVEHVFARQKGPMGLVVGGAQCRSHERLLATTDRQDAGPLRQD